MKNTENTDLKSVKDRLIYFINSKGLSQGRFEKITNLSNGYVNNIKNTITDKTFDHKIKPSFPDLNKLWILHGDGDMIISAETTISTGSKEDDFSKLSVDDKLNYLYKQNEDLKEENENLKDLLEDLTLKMEISLAPILRHFKLKADDSKGKLHDKTSTN